MSCVFLRITIKAAETMVRSNQTSMVTEFFFSGLPEFEDGNLLFFIPLLIIYIFIIIGNLIVFFAVRMDTHLHNPMYNFIKIFSFMESGIPQPSFPNAVQSHQ